MQQAEEQRNALDRGSRSRADEAFNRYKMIGDAIDKGMDGYQEGKRLAREGEAHKKQMELTEEQINSSKGSRERQDMDTAFKYGPNWRKVQAEPADLRGPSIAHMGAPSRAAQEFDMSQRMSEDQLATSAANRGLLTKQTALLGQKTPAEKAAEARGQAESALYSAQSLPPGPERQKIEEYARSKVTEAGMSGTAFDVLNMEAASKYRTAQEAAAAARNVTATTTPGYSQLDTQLGQQDESANTLLTRANAYRDFDRAWTGLDSEKEAAALETMSAGRPPGEQEVLNASWAPFKGSKTERAKELLQSDSRKLEQQLAIAKQQAATHPTLQPRVDALAKKLFTVQMILQDPKPGETVTIGGVGYVYQGGDYGSETSWMPVSGLAPNPTMQQASMP